jgi:serine/threonine protein kinase
MQGHSWKRLEGEILDGRVRLTNLRIGEREGVFDGQWLEGLEVPGDRAVSVHLFPLSSEPVPERYLEVSFLEHPNLVRCFGAGESELRNERLHYAVMAKADKRLNEVLATRALDSAETRRLVEDVLGALRYLHARNLVYCNLDPSSVVRDGDCWKLCEFSQLRIEGHGYMNETRRLLGMRPSTPPEAYEGVVHASWDVWSLGCLISAALTGPRMGPNDDPAVRWRRRMLPEPFETIIFQALLPDRRQRCSLDRIQELLAEVRSTGADQRVSPEQVEPERNLAPAAPVEPVRYLVPDPSFDTPPRHRQFAISTRRRRWVPVIGGLVAVAALGFVTLTQSARQPPSAIASSTASNPARSSAKPAAPRPNSTEGEADRNSQHAAELTAVRGVLDRWAALSRSGDIESQSQLYAPRLERFFNSRNVSRDWVQRRRLSSRRRLGDVTTFDLSNIQINANDPDRATATFDKTWEYEGQTRYSAKMQSELGFRKIDGDWSIVSERDLRVYWSRKTRR